VDCARLVSDEPAAAARPIDDTLVDPAGLLDLLEARRSIGLLVEPGPSDAELELIARAAASAPDHKRLGPYEVVVCRGDGRRSLGAAMAAAFRREAVESGRTPSDAEVAAQAKKAERAPVILAFVLRPVDHRSVPRDEQVAATAAAAMASLVEVQALGYGSMWRTGAAATAREVLDVLGAPPEARVVGFLYLGTVPSTWRPAPVDRRQATHWRVLGAD
jgi:nitroreductase